MNQYDLMAKLPLEPPKRLVSSVKKRLKNEQFVIYRFTKTKAKCFCTKCKQTFYVNREPITGDKKIDQWLGLKSCYKCGTLAEYIHSSRICRSGNQLDCCYPATIKKINNHAGVILWRAELRLFKDGEIKLIFNPYEAYFFIGKRLFKYVAYMKYFTGLCWLEKWCAHARANDTFGAADFVLPFSEKYLNGTELENAKLDLFCKVKMPFIVQYFKCFQKHKNIENLVMQGYANFINDIFKKGFSYYFSYSYYNDKKIEEIINFKEKKPYKMLGLSNKKEFEFFKQHTVDEIKLFVKMKKIDKSFDCKYISLASELNAGAICDEKYVKLSFNKILKYLAKQELEAENALGDCDDEVINCHYYRNYIDMAAKIGDIDYFPKNLIAAHDRVNERKTLLENKNQNVKIKKRYKELEKFCFSADGLFIRPAKSVYEFVKEGNKLHHCVATYTARHADGRTNIFFIRKADEPNKPFYTLELDLTKIQVVQNRGLHNCARTDEVIKFEEKFMKFVKETIRKEQKKNGRNDNLRSANCA